MNNYTCIGNLTRDPELTYTQGKGTALCKFGIAINEGYGDNKRTDYLNCLAWGKQAESIANNLVKGSKVAIAGKIQTGSYDAKDGTKRYTTDVVIREIDFLSKKTEEHQAQTNNFGSFNYEEDMTLVDSGDIPF